MSLPTFDEFFTPILEVMQDNITRSRREVIELVANHVGLSQEQKADQLGSGQPVYQNRIGWGMSYLTSINALNRPKRGHYEITEIGHKLLHRHPNGMTYRDIEDLPGYPRSPRKNTTKKSESAAKKKESIREIPDLTPEERIEEAISEVHAGVRDELLKRLHSLDPQAFEQTVLDLLIAMGYGGADGKATCTPYTNDEGIDGIIDQDALGLNRIYVQAKRYKPDSPIGRKEIQSFTGALQGQQASQGVFITTSRFTKNAYRYVETIHSRIVLIDGQRLVKLMLQYQVGVQTKETYKVVSIDEDYFE